MKHPLMNYNRLLYHIIFRTKHSLPAITEAALWGRADTAGFVRHRSLHQPVKHSFAPPGQFNPYLLIDLQ